MGLRLEAAKTLGRVGDLAAAESLRLTLADTNLNLRIVAAEALARFNFTPKLIKAKLFLATILSTVCAEFLPRKNLTVCAMLCSAV